MYLFCSWQYKWKLVKKYWSKSCFYMYVRIQYTIQRIHRIIYFKTFYFETFVMEMHSYIYERNTQPKTGLLIVLESWSIKILLRYFATIKIKAKVLLVHILKWSSYYSYIRPSCLQSNLSSRVTDCDRLLCRRNFFCSLHNLFYDTYGRNLSAT